MCIYQRLENNMELRKYKLGDIGEVRMCKRILKEETNTISGIPFYKIGTFGNKADVFISLEKFKEYKEKFSYPKKGDILISAAGTIGRTVIYDGSDSYFQDSNIVWIDNDETKVLNKYLFYCYKNIHWFTSKGSTILRLYNDNIRNTEIVVPPLESQKKIAAVLSTLDDKIALNRRMNAKLEQMAKRLYDHWFVQFDFPNADGKPYKSSGGKMEYNEVLKHEIPAGWEVGNLYDIAEYVNGLACQNYRPKESEKSLPVIKIREMNEGITADTEKVSASISGKYRIYAGDILFSWSASLEIKIWTGETGGLNQHIFKVIPKGYFSKGYVYQQLSAYLVNFQKMAESRKTTMGHITSDHIKQSRILIPPKEIISAFTKKTLSIFNYQLSIEKEITKLTALRDRLLPLLMNGQVEVM